MAKAERTILGLMSGSSLDGLDMALCRFQWPTEDQLEWELLQGQTVPFSDLWRRRLTNLPQQSARTFAKTHTYFGRYMAEMTVAFLSTQSILPDFIASHGHTVFHEPDAYLTCQIGDGAALAALTGIPVICDFRTTDVALGGEGAPLAPVADKWLFSDYAFALNIGGIANISCTLSEAPLAMDVAPANQVSNALAALLGNPYDAEGALAQSGQMIPELLAKLDQLDFYKQKPPRSLGNHWVRQTFLPLILEAKGSVADRLHTFAQHLTGQIAKSILLLQQKAGEQGPSKVLVTGGGAYHRFWLQLLRAQLPGWSIELPEAAIIDYKEALLMALLGELRLQCRPNVYRSMTGAKKDVVGGCIYWA